MGEAKRRGTKEEREQQAKSWAEKQQYRLRRFIHLSMLIGKSMSMGEIYSYALRGGLYNGKK